MSPVESGGPGPHAGTADHLRGSDRPGSTPELREPARHPLRRRPHVQDPQLHGVRRQYRPDDPVVPPGFGPPAGRVHVRAEPARVGHGSPLHSPYRQRPLPARHQDVRPGGQTPPPGQPSGLRAGEPGDAQSNEGLPRGTQPLTDDPHRRRVRGLRRRGRTAHRTPGAPRAAPVRAAVPLGRGISGIERAPGP